jgi:hypothetical protein
MLAAPVSTTASAAPANWRQTVEKMEGSSVWNAWAASCHAPVDPAGSAEAASARQVPVMAQKPFTGTEEFFDSAD